MADGEIALPIGVFAVLLRKNLSDAAAIFIRSAGGAKVASCTEYIAEIVECAATVSWFD